MLASIKYTKKHRIGQHSAFAEDKVCIDRSSLASFLNHRLVNPSYPQLLTTQRREHVKSEITEVDVSLFRAFPKRLYVHVFGRMIVQQCWSSLYLSSTRSLPSTPSYGISILMTAAMVLQLDLNVPSDRALSIQFNPIQFVSPSVSSPSEAISRSVRQEMSALHSAFLLHLTVKWLTETAAEC